MARRRRGGRKEHTIPQVVSTGCRICADLTRMSESTPCVLLDTRVFAPFREEERAEAWLRALITTSDTAGEAIFAGGWLPELYRLPNTVASGGEEVDRRG